MSVMFGMLDDEKFGRASHAVESIEPAPEARSIIVPVTVEHGGHVTFGNICNAGQVLVVL